MEPPYPNQKAHCNTCDGERNHRTLFQYTDNWDDEEYQIHGYEEIAVLKCCGCDGLKSRSTEFVSNWGCEASVSYLPAAKSRKLPAWLHVNPLRFFMNQTFVPSLLNQIYSSYHSGGFSLAAMGIRALVEQAMIDKVGDHGTFQKNLSKFGTQGYIGSVQSDFLEATLEVGHAAIHRNYAPSGEDIRHSLDIVEPILETIYIHEGHASKLQKAVPKRTRQP